MLLPPWTSVFSGLAILLASLGFNLFGDGLRDLLDPTLRGYKHCKLGETLTNWHTTGTLKTQNKPRVGSARLRKRKRSEALGVASDPRPKYTPNRCQRLCCVPFELVSEEKAPNVHYFLNSSPAS